MAVPINAAKTTRDTGFHVEVKIIATNFIATAVLKAHTIGQPDARAMSLRGIPAECPAYFIQKGNIAIKASE